LSLVQVGGNKDNLITFGHKKIREIMAEAIRMPLLSDTMKEGVIAAWHKKVGDKVKSDDVIADVETDKATMEVMPYVDGTLLYVGVEQGKAAKINEIIAIIGKEGEDFSSILNADNSTQSEEVSSPKQETPRLTTPKEPINATVVRMPLLSDTMKEGKIVAWHKKVGDKVKSDDVIADVETDKATMEVMPYADGTLLYLGVNEGESVPINGIIAIVGKENTDISSLLNENTEASNVATAERKVSSETKSETIVLSSTSISENERVKASPLAKRIAKEKGINLQQIHGSGDGGRIIKRDIESVPTASSQAVAPIASINVESSSLIATSSESYTDHPLSQMRKVIAQRLSESMFTAPHFYLKMTVNMDEAIKARKSINEVATAKVSFNDMIIKAVSMTLRKHPAVNSSWMGDFIRSNNHINIGSAVAIEDGLIVPVIKHADQKSLSQIATESKSLTEKARSKKLQPQEFTGNTFTISNLGMMDIDEFTAIINPPDSCILAVGKIAPTPVVENGQVVVRNLLKLTLSCDHRVVDGAVGSSFLQTLKSYLEQPVTMLA